MLKGAIRLLKSVEVVLSETAVCDISGTDRSLRIWSRSSASMPLSSTTWRASAEAGAIIGCG